MDVDLEGRYVNNGSVSLGHPLRTRHTRPETKRRCGLLETERTFRPRVAAYKENLDEDEQVAFKGSAKTFVRTYDFLASACTL